MTDRRLLYLRPLPLLSLALACGIAPMAHAADPPDAPPVVAPEWNLRLRNEYVSDDTFPHRGDAATARLRAGLRFRFGEHVSALVEGEGIASANGDNGWLSAKSNCRSTVSRTRRPCSSGSSSCSTTPAASSAR